MAHFLKKAFIPYHSNNFHPHLLRAHGLFTFALLFSISNYFVFPLLGLNVSRVAASSISTEELVADANQDRAQAGLSKLTLNTKLTAAANAKAQDMFAKQYWSHFGPSGETPWQFIKGAGYEYFYAGENLARNFTKGSDVHAAWMNSPTHRANIMNSNFKDIGLAIVEGKLEGEQTILVVQMFGAIDDIKPKTPLAQVQKTVTPSPKIVEQKAVEKQLTAPKIDEPTDGSFINQNKVTIKGTSKDGKSLKVYSNDILVGELPKQDAAFSINVELKEDVSRIYVKAKENTVDSPASNTVTVNRDLTPPDITGIDFVIRDEGESLFITTTLEEKLTAFRYQVGDLKGNFEANENKFSLTLVKNQIENPYLQVWLTDLAGNTSEGGIDLSPYLKNDENNVLGTVVAPVSPSQRETLLQKLSSMSVGEILDIGAITGLLLIIAVDAYLLYKKGIRRELGSYHPFNIAIIVLFVFSVAIF
jgi:uncharacterized protein YkwD